MCEYCVVVVGIPTLNKQSKYSQTAEFHPSSTKKLKLNSVAIVRKRTIPTERPPLVGQVSANLCGLRVLRGQRNEFPRPLISVFYTGAATFSFK
jgi:hypothetical protein